MIWPFKKKPPPPTPEEIAHYEELARFRNQPVAAQLAWYDTQPWGERANQAWRLYWEDRGETSPINDSLARIRFMAAWDVAETDPDRRNIDLPFIGMTTNRDFLHLQCKWSRAKDQ